MKREALKRARELIADRSERYICNALGSVAVRHPHLRNTCDRLKSYIERQLDGYTALGAWQKNNLDPIRNARSTRETLRADRLDWIDWMLGWEMHGGGECPANLRNGMSIQVRFRNGGEASDSSPCDWRWNHTPTGRTNRDFDIVAYRVL